MTSSWSSVTWTLSNGKLPLHHGSSSGWRRTRLSGACTSSHCTTYRNIFRVWHKFSHYLEEKFPSLILYQHCHCSVTNSSAYLSYSVCSILRSRGLGLSSFYARCCCTVFIHKNSVSHLLWSSWRAQHTCTHSSSTQTHQWGRIKCVQKREALVRSQTFRTNPEAWGSIRFSLADWLPASAQSSIVRTDVLRHHDKLSVVVFY